MLLRVFLLLDHLAPGARGAAVRSELPGARNAACGPPPLSSLPPPPFSPPLSTELLPLPCHTADLHSFHPSPPSLTPLISAAHFSRCPHANSPPLRSHANSPPPGGYFAMWPRRTPGRAARPHGAARSRIPLGAPRVFPYLCACLRACVGILVPHPARVAPLRAAVSLYAPAEDS